jgi:hypothetical protein
VRALTVALALTCWAGSAAAQSMRPFTTFRQLHGETRLRAALDYAAGTLRLVPGRPTELYRMDISYDEERYVPVSDFDAARGNVSLGLRPSGQGGIRVVSKSQLRQAANLTFSPRVDLDLDVTLGAVDADLELGGLRIGQLNFKAGASRVVVRFSEPNGVRCRSAKLSAGAAELSVIGLGNSRCDRIEFEGGMGKVMLDLSGSWNTSSQVAVKMAMGEMTLRLPRGVGIRLTLDKFLSSFQPADLVRQGKTFVSPNYDRAERRLDLEVSTAVGGVTVEWAN